jgi:nucleotide-binding universal stress UspA family protein
MSYRAILVHVPLTGGDAQIGLAAKLAKETGAHLTGLCSLEEVALLRSARQNPFLRLEPARVEELIGREYQGAAEAEKRFDAIAARAGVSHYFVVGEGDAADLLIHASRLQDLSVVEQSADPSDLLWGPVVQLALSGHPALIVPRGWASPQFGSRVLVAWNGSAQSAAAVRKALPLLQRADEVTVLTGASRAAFPSMMRLPPLDVMAYLKHEGVAAKVKKIAVADDDAGAAILKHARNGKCDLIVMGAFGRSRFSEWILGGATRHVLEHMTVPVLMAHQ